MTTTARVTVERDGHVLLIGLDRPEKRNAADLRMLQRARRSPTGCSTATPSCGSGLVCHATATTSPPGSTSPTSRPRSGADGLDIVPEGGLHPWQVDGRSATKPVVARRAGHLPHARDRARARERRRRRRGVDPLRPDRGRAAASCRSAARRCASRARVGWGDAMRWMLTGDLFDAEEARRIGLVQEVVPDGEPSRPRPRARPSASPRRPRSAVQATLANARLAVREGDAAAEARLQPELVRLARDRTTRDRGIEAFLVEDDGGVHAGADPWLVCPRMPGAGAPSVPDDTHEPASPGGETGSEERGGSAYLKTSLTSSPIFLARAAAWSFLPSAT